MKQNAARGFYRWHSKSASTANNFSKRYISRHSKGHSILSHIEDLVQQCGWKLTANGADAQVTVQPSDCPAGESFTALNQKLPQVLQTYRPDPAK